MGYLIYFKTSGAAPNPFITLMRIAGLPYQIETSTAHIETTSITTHFYAVAAKDKNSQQLTAQLQAVPGYQESIVAALSIPAKEEELPAVRRILQLLNWDQQSLSDRNLLVFLNARFKGEFNEPEVKEWPNKEGENSMNYEAVLDELEKSTLNTTSSSFPKNLQELTDEEIRKWIRDNDTRDIKDEQINITRNGNNITVSIKFSWHTEYFSSSGFGS